MPPFSPQPKPASRVLVKRAKKAEAESNWRKVVKAVNARDGYKCRVCGKRCNPEAVTLLEKGHHHHIVYRSAGGEDTTANLVTLCVLCHDAEHRHELKIEGHGDTGLEVWRVNDAGWFLVKREIAPF